MKIQQNTQHAHHQHRSTAMAATAMFGVLMIVAATHAQSSPSEAAVTEPPSSTPTAAEKKARYSLPYALRPAVAPNLARIDGALAFQDTAFTLVSVITAGGKPISALQDLGFYVRGGLVHNSPDVGSSETAWTNPLVFALYTPEIAKNWRLAMFGGVTIPMGSGGGDTASPTSRSSIRSGVYARQGMDNALFATNYMTPTAGLALAYIAHGLTAQAEVTVLELLRVRGSTVEPDSSRTNFTSGIHLGYQIIPLITASIEGHYQHWISTPAAVKADSTLRSQTTLGVGVRLNVPLTHSIIARPGLALFNGLDDPMARSGYRIVLLDMPVAF